MKKLFKKFCILALISLLIGYNANKKNQEDMQPVDVVDKPVVEQVDVNFSFQEVKDPEVIEPQETVIEEIKPEIKPTPSPSPTTVPVKVKTQEIVQMKVDMVVENKVEPTVTVKPTATPGSTATPEPVIVQTPAPTVKPVETPKPTPVATPTPQPTVAPTPEPQFDISYWISFAQNYAQNIGLVLESSAVDCWDNPIPAGNHCLYIEQNITDRLNRYKNLEGFTDVWIWYEDTGNNTYNIYIGYA